MCTRLSTQPKYTAPWCAVNGGLILVEERITSMERSYRNSFTWNYDSRKVHEDFDHHHSLASSVIRSTEENIPCEKKIIPSLQKIVHCFLSFGRESNQWALPMLKVQFLSRRVAHPGAQSNGVSAVIIIARREACDAASHVLWTFLYNPGEGSNRNQLKTLTITAVTQPIGCCGDVSMMTNPLGV